MCERLLLWFYLYSLLSQLPEIQSFRVTIKRGVMLPDRNEAPDIMALYNRRCREIFSPNVWLFGIFAYLCSVKNDMNL